MIHRYTYKFEGAIWNMLADPVARYLVLEIRSEAQHQVSFAMVDLESDTLVWQDVTFEEPWWIGATATDGATVVFHIYQDSQNPQSKRYFAVDVASRRQVWHSDTFQVMGIEGNDLLGFEKQEKDRAYKLISFGDRKEIFMSKEDVERLLPGENKNLHYPFHYIETQPHFETVKQFIIHYTNTKPVQGCEYLEYKNLILISYYIQESSALANYLLVIDGEGQLYLQEVLDTNLSQIGLGTFFIANDKLVLIKEKNQLISYALQNL